ncbi:MAG: acyltransferase family protein, partial [Micromonosporaceae bacterium]
LTSGSRWLSAGLVGAGLAGLLGLVTLAGYPRSMVGIPGDRWSNMAPPTLAVVALLSVQVGLIGLLRPVAERWVSGRRPAAVIDFLGRYALGLFLCHSSGMAAYRYLLWLFTGGGLDPVPPDLTWWLSRPVAVVGSLVCTVPLVYVFARWGGPFGERLWRRLPDRRAVGLSGGDGHAGTS